MPARGEILVADEPGYPGAGITVQVESYPTWFIQTKGNTRVSLAWIRIVLIQLQTGTHVNGTNPGKGIEVFDHLDIHPPDITVQMKKQIPAIRRNIRASSVRVKSMVGQVDARTPCAVAFTEAYIQMFTAVHIKQDIAAVGRNTGMGLVAILGLHLNPAQAREHSLVGRDCGQVGQAGSQIG